MAKGGILLRCFAVLVFKGVVVSNLPERVPIWFELKLSKVSLEAPVSLRLMAFVAALSNVTLPVTVDACAHGWCYGIGGADVAMASCTGNLLILM